jgi:hypothetical protein
MVAEGRKLKKHNINFMQVQEAYEILREIITGGEDSQFLTIRLLLK